MRQEELEEQGKSKSTAKEVLDWILYIGIVLILSWLIVTFVGVRTVVDGQSMEPTLQDGNNLIVDKLSYRFRDPKRYEIIVFPYKYEENTYYIKRIIGLPGETVQVKNTGRFILTEKFWERTMELKPWKTPGLPLIRSNWGRTSTLSLGITAITVRTAEIRA